MVGVEAFRLSFKTNFFRLVNYYDLFQSFVFYYFLTIYRVSKFPFGDEKNSVLIFINDSIIMINEIDFVDMIAVPYLNVLAMENWGLVTYQRPFLVIPINAGFKTKYESTLVIAHEIAHQVERYNHYCNNTIIWFIM